MASEIIDLKSYHVHLTFAFDNVLHYMEVHAKGHWKPPPSSNIMGKDVNVHVHACIFACSEM